MYDLLIRLMLITACLELGISAKEFYACSHRGCLARMEANSRQILHIDWKPISLFPGEAKRFQSASHARGDSNEQK